MLVPTEICPARRQSQCSKRDEGFNCGLAQFCYSSGAALAQPWREWTHSGVTETLRAVVVDRFAAFAADRRRELKYHLLPSHHPGSALDKADVSFTAGSRWCPSGPQINGCTGSNPGPGPSGPTHRHIPPRRPLCTKQIRESVFVGRAFASPLRAYHLFQCEHKKIALPKARARRRHFPALPTPTAAHLHSTHVRTRRAVQLRPQSDRPAPAPPTMDLN